MKENFCSQVFWEIFGLCALLCIHATFSAGVSAILRLRTASADVIRKDPRIKKFAKHADLNVQALRFFSITCAVLSGILFYVLMRHTWHFFGDFDFLFILAFIAFIIIYFLVCEMLATAISFRGSERFLRVTVTWMLLLRNVAFPFVLVARFIFRRLQKLFNLPNLDTHKLADTELLLKALGVELEGVQPITRAFLTNALELKNIDVRDVIIPRNQVILLDENDSLPESLEKVKSCGHTRFPLCKGDLDHCTGLIHLKDIFRYRGSLESLSLEKIKRPIVRLNSDVSVDIAIDRMLRMQMHMALVVDEFGGSIGIVTLETLLEELVGDIRDEFDREENDIVQLSENVFLISGLTPLHDVENALDVEIGDEEVVSTISGLITSELGRIPRKDERIQIGRMDIQILQVDQRRIISLKVHLQEEEPEEPSGE